jgi:hypothetical protein
MKGSDTTGAMKSAVTDPSEYGMWEPTKDLKTDKVYWTNHTLQMTVWKPPRSPPVLAEHADYENQ